MPSVLSYRPHGWNRVAAATILAAVVIGGFAGRAIANHTQLVVMGGLGAVFLVAYWQYPPIAIHATLAYATLTLPVSIPVAIHPLGLTVNVWDLLIVLGVLEVHRSMRPPQAVTRGVAILGLSWLMASIIGWYQDNEVAYWFLESRVQFVFIAAIYVGAGIGYSDRLREFRRTLLAVLWISAPLLALSALSIGPTLLGRRTSASLNGAATDVARLLTNTQFAALAAVCVCLCMFVAGQQKWPAIWPYLVPSVLIVFLSFSRNTLIAVAISLVVVAIGRRSAIRPTATLLALGIGIALLGSFTLWVSAGTETGTFLQSQVDAYKSRVLLGAEGNALSADNSAQARVLENANLVSSFEASPIVGHGYGHAYQDATGTSDFTQNLGRYYAHNFYLWWLVKAGLLGMGAFVFAIVWPLISAVRQNGHIAPALVATSFGLLGVSYVAPLPSESPSSLIVGAVIGVALGVSSREKTNGKRLTSCNEPHRASTITSRRRLAEEPPPNSNRTMLRAEQRTGHRVGTGYRPTRTDLKSSN